MKKVGQSFYGKIYDELKSVFIMLVNRITRSIGTLNVRNVYFTIIRVWKTKSERVFASNPLNI